MKYFLGLIFISLVNSGFAQEDAAVCRKNILLYGEILGNGGYYSLNTELTTKKKNHISGHRLGISYFQLNQKNTPGQVRKTSYISVLYERNYLFGNGRVKPELGVGYTFFFFNQPLHIFYSGQSPYYFGKKENTFYLNGNKMLVWFNPRIGFRYYSGENTFVRFGFTPAVFVTELNEKQAQKFALFGGISFGYVIKSF